MEGKGISMMVWLVVVGVAVAVAVVQNGAEAASCPSTNQLGGTCGQYVVGSNPPVPPPGGACCSLLKSASPSCLCNSIPASARSLVSKKGLSNVRSSCGLAVTCPGI